jgi:hypothetical protein
VVQYALARGLGPRGGGESTLDDAEFFDCVPPEELSPSQPPMKGSGRKGKTSLRVRFHLADGGLTAYETDEGLLAGDGTSMQLSLRDLNVVALAGPGSTSVEFNLASLLAEELVLDRAGGRTRNRLLALDPDAGLGARDIVPPPPLQGTVEVKVGGGGEDGEGERPEPATSTEVQVNFQPLLSDLPLTSVRRWSALMGEGSQPERPEGAQRGARAAPPPAATSRVRLSCPQLGLILPFTPEMLRLPAASVLRTCLDLEDETERRRWAAARGRMPGVEFRFGRATLEAGSGGLFRIEFGEVTAGLVMDIGGEICRLGAVRTLPRQGVSPFFEIALYEQCQMYASSLEKTLAPELREWERVEPDGDLMADDHRELPTSDGPMMHLHLPDVSIDLTLVERMALVELMVAAFSAPDEPREAGAVEDVSSPEPEEHQESKGGGMPFLVSSGSALLVLHETKLTSTQAARCSYTAAFEGLCLYFLPTGAAESHLRATANDITVFEAEHGDDPRIIGRCHSQHGHQGVNLLHHTPVLYKNKWAIEDDCHSPGSGKPLVVLDMIKSSPRTLSIYLSFHMVSLRYRVDSLWLPRSIGLIAAGPDSLPPHLHAPTRVDALAAGAGSGEMGSGRPAPPPGPPFVTQMFVRAYDGTLDYNGSTSRTVLSFGRFRVSSNMVAGGDVQVYNIMVRDVVVHMTNAPTDYTDEDATVLGRELLGLAPDATDGLDRADTITLGADVRSSSLSQPPPASAQQFLERQGFVQLATVHFVDALLDCKSGPLPPDGEEPLVNVKVSIGPLHMYTCGDSFGTLQDAAMEWWCRLTDERGRAATTARPASTDGGRLSAESLRTLPEPASHAVDRDSFFGNVKAPPVHAASVSERSLLDGVVEEMFVPQIVSQPKERAAPASKGRAAGAASSRASVAASPLPRLSRNLSQSSEQMAPPVMDLSKVVLIEDFHMLGPSASTAARSERGGGNLGGQGDEPEWQGGWLPRDDADALDDYLLEVQEDEEECDMDGPPATRTPESLTETQSESADGAGVDHDPDADADADSQDRDDDSYGLRPGGLFRKDPKDLEMEMVDFMTWDEPQAAAGGSDGGRDTGREYVDDDPLALFLFEASPTIGEGIGEPLDREGEPELQILENALDLESLFGGSSDATLSEGQGVAEDTPGLPGLQGTEMASLLIPSSGVSFCCSCFPGQEMTPAGHGARS